MAKAIKKRKLKHYNMDMFKDMLERLKAESAETGLSVTALIRMALDEKYPKIKD